MTYQLHNRRQQPAALSFSDPSGVPWPVLRQRGAPLLDLALETHAPKTSSPFHLPSSLLLLLLTYTVDPAYCLRMNNNAWSMAEPELQMPA